MTASAKDVGFGPRFAAPLLIGSSMNPINTTMISVALAPIAADVGVSAATAIWLVASLYLVSSIFQPTMGKFADQFGPRKIYLLGMTTAMIAGIIPTLSPTFAGALIARILIGVGTSCAYPAAMSAISDQSARLHKDTPPALLSSLSIASLVIAVIGPTFGGVLIEAFGWQSIFLVNIPMAATGALLALLWLPADSTRGARNTSLPLTSAVDFPGIFLFAITLGTAMFFLLDIRGGMYWLIAVALAAGVALVKRELKVERPFLDLGMLGSNKPLRRTYLRWFLLMTAFYMIIYGVTQWMQSSADLPSDVTGLVQLPSAVIAFVTSFFILRTTKVYRPLIVAAIGMTICGIFVLTLHAASPLWYLVFVISIYGIPHGLNSISNQAAMYRQAPQSQIGNAAGLSRAVNQVGAVLASCIIGWVYGDVATDVGVHVLGIVIIVLSASCFVLTFLDKSLKKPLKDYS